MFLIVIKRGSLVSHIFNVNNRNKLDSEERKRLLAPAVTLKSLGYQKGEVFADIGCGTGLFTIPAAELGGEFAKIYAVDVSDEMLSEVKRRAVDKGYNNIETVQSSEYDFWLPDEEADFVLICTVLHEIENANLFLNEAKRICKKSGNIAVIEFNEGFTNFGPPLSHRLTRKQTAELLTNAGFLNINAVDISEAFYAVTATK
jgi:ubiquinone/menaquinone biosynthesis C-methylase UbiE